MTGTSDRISLEGEVTSLQVSALDVPFLALVSVALSALLEGVVSSWQREDASASPESLDDVASTASALASAS